MGTIKGLWILAFCSISVFAHAQNARVLVYDGSGQDSSAVPQAAIVVNDTLLGVTDSNGLFLWSKAVKGDRIKALFVGSSSPELIYKGESELVLRLKSSTILSDIEIIDAVDAVRIDSKALDFRQQINARELRRAACCNLSESFENNPSIDVSITDAVSGTRELELLGLSGRFMQTQLELLPVFRGLSLKRGFAQIPGAWVSSMQLSKGAGSVVYGHESTTGQLNIELLDPETAEGTRFNAYLNQTGRSELNATHFFKAGEAWKSGLLLHGSVNPRSLDRNGDLFADQGSGHLIHFLNRWNYRSKDWEGKIFARVLEDVQRGGQTDFSFDEAETAQSEWGLERQQRLVALSGKIGYLFPENDRSDRSIGLMISGALTDQKAFAGLNRVDAVQSTLYTNAIYEINDKRTKQDWRLGASANLDAWEQSNRLDTLDYESNWLETEYGLFAEWGWNPNPRLGLLMGLRVDAHGYLGTRASPRVHVKYQVLETTWLRLSAGRGWRAAQPWLENFEMLASSRSVAWDRQQLQPTSVSSAESAWNAGGSIVRDFQIDYRKATLSVDVYGTWFEQMVYADREVDANQLRMRALNGSGNLSTLVQFEWQIKRKMDIRLAYKFSEPWLDRPEGRIQTPYVSRHRALLAWFYETRKQWGFDLALQWRGGQRLISPVLESKVEDSPGFVVVNAQVKKRFGDRWEAYVGAENLLGFVQKQPIVSPETPFEPGFDATLIWGPVMGRIVFVGLNWQLISSPSSAD